MFLVNSLHTHQRCRVLKYAWEVERKQVLEGNRLRRRKDHLTFRAVNCGLDEDWVRKSMWLGVGEEPLKFGEHNLQHWLSEDRTPKPACEMKLQVQILLICSQFACILSVTALSLYICANKGSSVLVRGGSLLGRILVNWSMYWNYYPMFEKYWFIIIILCGLCMFLIVGKGGPWMLPQITVSLCNWNRIANSYTNGIKSIMSRNLCCCIIGLHERQRST